MSDKLGQDSAFPTDVRESGVLFNTEDRGMSKRFYAACVAMQGILSGEHKALTCVKSGSHINYGGYDYTYNFQKLIENSYKLADELLKQENE